MDDMERMVGTIEDALSSAADCSGGYDHGADGALTALCRLSDAVLAHPHAADLAWSVCHGCEGLMGLKYPSCVRDTCDCYRFRQRAGV